MNRLNIYKKHLVSGTIGIITNIWKKDIDNNIIFSRIPLTTAYITVDGICGDNNQYTSGERSVLIQTVDNYSIINKEYSKLPYLSKNNAGCGENICIDGIDINTIYIGDILRTDGGVLLQVTSPRKPCTRWTKKYNDNSLRLYILRNTLGGIFFRVLKPGKIMINEHIYLHKRIQHKWSIRLIGDKLYSNHDDDIYDDDCWSGNDKELDELYNLETLADKDWKNEIKRLIEEKE